MVIGDIISFKKVENRHALQNKLLDVFNILNASDHENHLVSPYAISLGDEFQAVYEKADCLFLDSIRILEKTLPQKIRLSVGIGEISTDINPGTIDRNGWMDGWMAALFILPGKAY